MVVRTVVNFSTVDRGRSASSFARSRTFLESDELFSDEEDDDLRRSIADRAYWTKRIHRLCAKDRDVHGALRLLYRLNLHGYIPDSLNISSIIHSLCNSGRFSEAHNRLILFITSGCIPDERTCNVLLAILLNARTPHATLSVARRLIQAKPKFVPSIINYNRFIHQLCLISRPAEAHGLLYEMTQRGHRPNVVTYTTLVSGYCKTLRMNYAQKLLDEMTEKGILLNSLTRSIFIRGTMRCRDVDRGRELMDQLWKEMGTDRDTNNAAFAAVMDSLCEQGYFFLLFQVLDEMPQRGKVEDEFAYAQMIDSLCKAGMNHGASRVVYVMRKRGFNPSSVSYNSIIHGLCNRPGGSMRAYQLFKEGAEFHYVISEDTYAVLVHVLCIDGLGVPKAVELLEYMLLREDSNRTRIRIFNIFFRALKNPDEILNTLVFMLRKRCRPDAITLNTIINAFCKAGRTEEALRVLEDMISGKFCEPDIISLTSLIRGFLDCGKIEGALHLLHGVIPERKLRPGIVTYNVVLRGLFRVHRLADAMRVFDGIAGDADRITHAIVLDGLFHCGEIERAKKFWDDVVWPSDDHDEFVYSAVLKGLCIHSRFDEAFDFLYELVDCGAKPNVVNYNILIDNACKLGLRKEAYQVVREMRRNGLEPDAVSWRILEKLH